MEIVCSDCGQRYSAPEKLAGKTIRCKKCGVAIAIPNIARRRPPERPRDSLQSLLDEELSSPADVSAPVENRPAAPRRFTSPSRNRPHVLKKVLAMFRERPARISWLVTLIAVPAMAIFWVMRLYATVAFLGTASEILAAVLFVLVMVSSWRGARVRYSVGGYLLSVALQLIGSIVAFPYWIWRMSQASSEERRGEMRTTMAAFPIAILLIAGIFASSFGRVAQFTELAMSLHGGPPVVIGQPAPLPVRRDVQPGAVAYTPPPQPRPIPVVDVRPADQGQAPRDSNAGPLPGGMANPAPRPQDVAKTPPQATARNSVPQNSAPPPMPMLNLSTEAASIWKAKPDPPSETIRISSDLAMRLPEELHRGHLLFPPLPSRFVVVAGWPGLNVSRYEAFDCEKMKSGGRVTFPLPSSEFASDPAISPDGQFLARQTDEKHVEIWSFKTGSNVNVLDFQDSPSRHFGLQFAGPDQLVVGRFVGTGERGGDIQVWSVAERRRLHRFDAEAFDVDSTALSPSGKYLAVLKESLSMYDVGSGECVGRRPVFQSSNSPWRCSNVVFSPDGRKLAALLSYGSVGGRDVCEIAVWDCSDGSTIIHHPVEVPLYIDSSCRNIKWFADSKGWLVAGKAVDGASGEMRWQTDPNAADAVYLVGGSHLVGIVNDYNNRSASIVAREASVEKATSLSSSSTPSNPISRSRTADDGAKVASNAIPNIWKVEPDPLAEEIRVSPELGIHMPSEMSIWGDALFPTMPSRFAVLGDPAHGLLTVWDCASQKCTGRIVCRADEFGFTKDLAVSPDGRFLAGERPKDYAHVDIWSFETGKRTADLQLPPQKSQESLRFIAPDRLLVTLRGEDRVQIWNVLDGRMLREIGICAHRKGEELGVSSTGRYLAVAGEHLAIYDLTTGDLVGARPFPKSKADEFWNCEGVAFSTDGREVAALFGVSDGKKHGSLEDVVLKIVSWDCSNGSVIVQHAVDVLGPNVHRHHNTGGRNLAWFAENKGWLVGDGMAVDHDSGRIRWERHLYHEAGGVSLVGGKQLLGLTSGLGKMLVACDVSVSKPVDLAANPRVKARFPFPTKGLAAVVRFQVLGYTGGGDQTAAARRALSGIAWIEPNAIAVNQDEKIISIGASMTAVNTAEAAAALKNAGFQIGAVNVTAVQE